MKKNSINLEKLSNEELQAVRGGAWKCDEQMPSYIKKKPRSCAYYAWLFDHCESVNDCSPTTWNPCY